MLLLEFQRRKVVSRLAIQHRFLGAMVVPGVLHAVIMEANPHEAHSCVKLRNIYIRKLDPLSSLPNEPLLADEATKNQC